MPKDQKSKSLWDYFISCMTKKYFCFQGRANRKEFWGFLLFSAISYVLIFEGVKIMTDYETSILIGSLYGVTLIIPFIAVYIRRSHDVDMSELQEISWQTKTWRLGGIMKSTNLIAVAYCSSYPKPNDYGHVPD